MKNPTSKSQITTIVLSVVLGISILTGGYFGVKSYQLNSSNEKLQSEVGLLKTVKNDLIAEIEGLQSDYNGLLSNNSELESTLATAILEMEDKEAELKRIKAQDDSFTLADEVKRLRMLKDEYAFILYELKIQSTILTNSNAELQNQNADLLDRMADMKEKNEALATKVFNLRRENTSGVKPLNASNKNDKPKAILVSNKVNNANQKLAEATNFTFDIRKKRNKPTGSSRRARKIAVRFDVKNLDNMPAGTEKLYLVIKDINGMPVQVESPIMVTVGSKKEEIIAQQMMTVNLSQHSSFKFEFMPKKKTLREGYYRASVYSDKGLIGSDQFHLR